MEAEQYGPTGDRLRDAILALPERLRVVLSLHYFEHRSDAQIAQILELPIATVTQLRTRAVRTLRAALDR